MRNHTTSRCCGGRSGDDAPATCSHPKCEPNMHINTYVHLRIINWNYELWLHLWRDLTGQSQLSTLYKAYNEYSCYIPSFSTIFYRKISLEFLLLKVYCKMVMTQHTQNLQCKNYTAKPGLSLEMFISQLFLLYNRLQQDWPYVILVWINTVEKHGGSKPLQQSHFFTYMH